jgi:hypothetical protein
LSLTPALHAGASNKNGNPFGNGTFFNTSGTFSAVVRGQNLSGTILFSTGANTNTSSGSTAGLNSITNTGFGIQGVSPGSSVIVYEGNTYQGNAAGLWNPSSGDVSGQFWGGQTLSGTNANSVYPEMYNHTNVITGGYTNIVTNIYTTNDPDTGYDVTVTNIYTNISSYSYNYWPYPVQTISNTIVTNAVISNGQTNYVTGSQTTTNVIYVEPVGTNYYQDSVYMNGSFDGSAQNNYPNQTFSASGSAVMSSLKPSLIDSNEGTRPIQMATNVTIAISVQGVRVSDSYSTFNTISNAVPYTQTAYSLTNISGF